MSVVPSRYCPPEIDEQELARLDPPVGAPGRAVMHDRAVRPGPRDGREGHVLQPARLQAKRLQPLRRVDLGEVPLRRLRGEPGEEAGDRGAVAAVGGAGALDLGGVLDRLHRRDRVRPGIRLPAGALDPPGERRRPRRPVDPHGRPGTAEGVEGGGEGVRRREIGQAPDRRPGLVRHLAGIEEQGRASLPRDEGVAQGQGRVADVAAAQVEEPGQVVGVGDEEGVEPRLGEFFAHPRKLRLAVLAGVLHRVRPHGRARRGRPVDPDHVDEIDLDRLQPRPGLGRGLLQPLDALDRVEGRVVGEAGAGGQVRPDPCLQARFGEGHRRDHGRIDLRRGLQRVAAVDEERRLVAEDHGRAGGAGEAGEPGEPLGVRGHVLPLVLVGARDHEPGKSPARQLRAQPRDALGALGGIGGVVEGLEAAHARAEFKPSGRLRQMRSASLPRSGRGWLPKAAGRGAEGVGQGGGDQLHRPLRRCSAGTAPLPPRFAQATLPREGGGSARTRSSASSGSGRRARSRRS